MSESTGLANVDVTQPRGAWLAAAAVRAGVVIAGSLKAPVVVELGRRRSEPACRCETDVLRFPPAAPGSMKTRRAEETTWRTRSKPTSSCCR
jgi:hypothetical protein